MLKLQNEPTSDKLHRNSKLGNEWNLQIAHKRDMLQYIIHVLTWDPFPHFPNKLEILVTISMQMQTMKLISYCLLFEISPNQNLYICPYLIIGTSNGGLKVGIRS
jgi:hypothetical protein